MARSAAHTALQYSNTQPLSMEVIDNVEAMRHWSELQRRDRHRIVLVPTMGFLHEAHLRLVRDAKQHGDRVVVSIFVNPTQFSPNEDFGVYPRDFERDRRLLEKENVDALFHPSTEQMYPAGYQSYVEVERLSRFLCGGHRPGHFRGVATVVAKLFNIVRPHVAIFGEKDYQQLQLIKRLVEDLNFDVDIVGHPIVREADGLAMSSRNAYLTPEGRRAALCLVRSLRCAAWMVERGVAQARAITDAVRAEIQAESLATLEYVTLCDAVTLDGIDEISDNALLALAVHIGKTRLIDNMILKR